MDSYSLNSVLNNLLKGTRYQEVYYFNQLCKYWCSCIFQEPICYRIVPMNLKRNTLKVIVADATYADYIKIRETVILSRIRATLQHHCISVIKTQVGVIKEIDIAKLKLSGIEASIHKK